MNIIETNLKFKEMNTRKETNRIILHHAEATECTAEQIHQWHLNNGWSGAGYHFLVRKDGTIYRLRPEDKVGAHAGGSNSDSIGICFEGKYMEETMPEAQLKAGQELVAYIKGKYNITKVQKHSDVCKTSCPGSNFPFDEIANVTVEQNPTVEKEEEVKEEVKKDQIKVDGKWGQETTKKAQKVFGTTVDGIVSNQYLVYKEKNKGLLSSTFEWEEKPSKNGSQLIKAIQKFLNIKKVDGFIGPILIKAMQKWLGTTVDGYVSEESEMVEAFQKWLNKQ